MNIIEYIWIDGCQPTQQIRSKTRLIDLPAEPTLADIPTWNFDGSSTSQATGTDSDCLLQPVQLVWDPLTNGGDFLVLCEVLHYDGTPHLSNQRAKLRQVLEQGGSALEPWLGFEQEYTMFKKNIPLGWPEHGFPGHQGPYYCGVGSEQIFGRQLAIDHMHACIDAGLLYYGMNAEVMPGQWEYQIGYRGNSQEDVSALTTTDHLWIARWLMHRLSEEYGVHISHDNKPVKGDWNGAGMHTNFSTKAMRQSGTGLQEIKQATEKLATMHNTHIVHYGDKLAERLTGRHETSTIDSFSAGEADRSSSIRIPKAVSLDGCGYLEDRRPGANADPYVVAKLLISAVI